MGVTAEEYPVRHLLEKQKCTLSGTYIYGFVKGPQVVEGKGVGKANIIHDHLHGNSLL